MVRYRSYRPSPKHAVNVVRRLTHDHWAFVSAGATVRSAGHYVETASAGLYQLGGGVTIIGVAHSLGVDVLAVGVDDVLGLLVELAEEGERATADMLVFNPPSESA